MSRAVRAVVCTELGPLDNVVVEERGTPRARARPGGRGRARRRGELRRRAHLPGPLPDEAGRALSSRAGRSPAWCSAVGEGVTRVQVGDRVMAMTGFGAFAEQVAVPRASLDPVPRRARLRPGGGVHPELLHGAGSP